MKTLLLTILMMATTAHASIVSDMLKVLPEGVHEGHGCYVDVRADLASEWQYIQISILDERREYVQGEQFVEKSYFNKVEKAEVTANSFSIKFTHFPDDQYSGKDVISLDFKDNQFKVKIKDFGPVGVFFSTKKAECILK